MQFLRDFRSAITVTVVVAGLGYFVDLFDITLFGVMRTISLLEIGPHATAGELYHWGLRIYNAQMLGLMIGGLIWGPLADRRGRLSVMMGSILLYSLANFANAFVWNFEGYMICRFLGGIGLAGELGAAITLVAESLPKEKRGFGTTTVAALGMLGIAAAALMGQIVPWRYAYALGGVMGLALLGTRLKVHESALFERTTAIGQTSRLRLLFTRGRFKKYLTCIAIGVPVYFTTGWLFTFAPELTKAADGSNTVSAATATLIGSFGLALGDLLSGLLSQRLKSRRQAVAISISIGLVLLWAYFAIETGTHEHGSAFRSGALYALTFLIGTCVGYWAVLITLSAESFGTDLRGTVATTVPNFVRGSALIAIALASLFQWIFERSFGFATDSHVGAFVAGTLIFGVALVCVVSIEETFSRDLDYRESVAAHKPS